MKKIIRRGAAATLAAVTLVTSAAVPVRAAAPRVQVDETMYVNLDYYGTATQINVVKGCTTNGLTEYTDYGTYDKVVNMTDDTAPEIGDGTVTWKLPEKNSRFYYQCTMPKNSVDLPWTFDVSYKLNGVEADASKLAGASGLVEVNVKATPNEKAKAYYKNNMVLTVLVPVDMEKCYSVDAPGAQVQSVGSYQAAMFAALPGEDGDFTVRVGTDNYENIGVIMMMVPGTLDELNRIKDLKEAKDTWREDGNKMYDSMNALLKTMESMKSDVSSVKGGLANLDQARGTVSANRKQLEALSTQALADLQAVTDQTTVMIPYLQTARDAVTDINSNTQALSNTMEDMQDELDRLYDRLGSLSKSLRSASDELNKGLVSQQTQDAIEKDIVQRTAEVQKILEELDKLLGLGNTSLAVTEQGIGSLNQSLATLDGMKLKRIRKMKSAEKEETSVSSEAASGNGNGQTAGAAGSADITDSAGAADHAKTTGSANTTDDAEMAAGTSVSGSAGTESKDSAEQEAAGAGGGSGSLSGRRSAGSDHGPGGGGERARPDGRAGRGRRPVAGSAGAGAQDRGYCNPDPYFRRGVPGREGERHRGLRGDRGGRRGPVRGPSAAAGGAGHCDGTAVKDEGDTNETKNTDVPGGSASAVGHGGGLGQRCAGRPVGGAGSGCAPGRGGGLSARRSAGGGHQSG